MTNDNINNRTNLFKKLSLRFVISFAFGIVILILTNFVPQKKNIQFDFTAKFTPEISQFLDFSAGGKDSFNYLNLFHDNKNLIDYFVHNENVKKDCKFSIVNESPVLQVRKENFTLYISFLSNENVDKNTCAKSINIELTKLMDRYFEFEKLRLESFLKDISNLGLQTIIDNKLSQLSKDDRSVELSLLDEMKISYLNNILEEKDYFIQFVDLKSTPNRNEGVFKTIVLLTVIVTFLILNISDFNRLVKKWE